MSNLASARDEPSIVALLSDERDEPTLHYTRKYMEHSLPNYLPAGNITQINFDMRDKMSQHILYQNGYLECDIDILPQAGTTFAASMPPITFKSSVLSALERIVVKTPQSNWIDEPDSIAIASHLRLMLEKDDSWFQVHGSEIMFHPDQASPDAVSALTSSGQLIYPNIRRFATAPDGTSNADNLFFNQGHLRRMKSTYDASLNNLGVPRFVSGANFATGFTVRCRFPLRYIHDLFEQLDFPVFGHHLQFEFHFNTASKSFNPLVIGATTVAAGVGGLNEPVVGANTGVSIRINNTTGYSPRLWYERCEFSNAQYQQLVARMASGSTKKVHFRTYNSYFNVPGMMNLVNGATPQLSIETGVVRPTRLIVLPMPASYYQLPSWPAPATGPNGLTRVQVNVNGEGIFKTTIDTPQQHYELLRDSMKTDETTNNLSLLPYGDFLRTHRFHVYDVSRFVELTPDTEAPCSLTLSCQIESTGNVDLIVLVERLRTLTIFQSEARVESKVVDGKGR